MPGYRTHLFGGAVIFAVVYYGIKNVVHPTMLMSCEWFLCTLAGSLFPDVDTRSRGRTWFYRILLSIMTFFAFSNAPIKLLVGLGIGLIPLFVRHRGVFHTMHTIFLGLLLLALVSYYIVPSFCVAITADLVFFAVGVMSHIYLDMGIAGLYR